METNILIFKAAACNQSEANDMELKALQNIEYEHILKIVNAVQII